MALGELSEGALEAGGDFQIDCHLHTASWLGAISLTENKVMLRKTVIALLAVGSVGLASPTMALARGGGGGSGGHGGGVGGGGGFHGRGVWGGWAPRWLSGPSVGTGIPSWWVPGAVFFSSRVSPFT